MWEIIRRILELEKRMNQAEQINANLIAENERLRMMVQLLMTST